MVKLKSFKRKKGAKRKIVVTADVDNKLRDIVGSGFKTKLQAKKWIENKKKKAKKAGFSNFRIKVLK